MICSSVFSVVMPFIDPRMFFLNFSAVMPCLTEWLPFQGGCRFHGILFSFMGWLLLIHVCFSTLLHGLFLCSRGMRKNWSFCQVHPQLVACRCMLFGRPLSIRKGPWDLWPLYLERVREEWCWLWRGKLSIIQCRNLKLEHLYFSQVSRCMWML